MPTITRPVNLTFQSEDVPALKAFIEANFMEEADLSGDENLTNQEILGWFESRAQDIVNKLQDRARKWAEENQKETLSQEYQDALAAKRAADEALRLLRERR